MPFRKISRNVKLAAVNLYEHAMNIYDLNRFSTVAGFSERTFWRILKLRKEMVMLRSTPMYGIRGRPRIFHFEDLQYLLRLVHHRPDWFLDEMLDLLDDNHLVAVHFSTIYHELARAGISRKRLRKIARERNEEWRADSPGLHCITKDSFFGKHILFELLSSRVAAAILFANN